MELELGLELAYLAEDCQHHLQELGLVDQDQLVVVLGLADQDQLVVVLGQVDQDQLVVVLVQVDQDQLVVVVVLGQVDQLLDDDVLEVEVHLQKT